MPLSESERRSLDALEASLLEHDPTFAKTMSGHKEQVMSSRNVTIGILVFIAGMAILLFGIGSNIIILGVAGFVIMGLGGFVLTKKVDAFETQMAQNGIKPKSPFMQKLEDEWDERKRREGNG